MDKGTLGIAGLVAGIVGLLVGGLAYMQAGKALSSANKALEEIEESASNADGTAEMRKAVRNAIEETKADLEGMVAEVRTEISRLESQAKQADVLLKAKDHADAIAERSSENLMTQVKALQAEIVAGDQDTKEYYKGLKVDLEKKLKESNEKLMRMTTTWIESGAM